MKIRKTYEEPRKKPIECENKKQNTASIKKIEEHTKNKYGEQVQLLIAGQIYFSAHRSFCLCPTQFTMQLVLPALTLSFRTLWKNQGRALVTT